MKIEKCPFCGGEVSIALCGDGFDARWFITRGHGENACKCRLFMESEKFNKDSEMADFVADDLIAAWNRRAQPENKPLTLDELRQMDGEPVYIVESPDWGHWELSYDAEDYMQNRDEDFYGMTCNAVKDGWCSGTCKYGLHNMGWIAYRRPLERSEG
jgi:hypothetical protein